MVLRSLSSSQSAAWNYAQGAFSRGLSANSALAAYRELGGSIRRSAFLDVFRQLRGEIDAGYHIRSVRKTQYPSEERIPEALTEIRRQYSFNVRLDMRNSVTNESFTRNITVTSDSLLTVGEIEEEAVNALWEGREGSQVEIEGTAVVSARKAGARGLI